MGDGGLKMPSVPPALGGKKGGLSVLGVVALLLIYFGELRAEVGNLKAEVGRMDARLERIESAMLGTVSAKGRPVE